MQYTIIKITNELALPMQVFSAEGPVFEILEKRIATVDYEVPSLTAPEPLDLSLNSFGSGKPNKLFLRQGPGSSDPQKNYIYYFVGNIDSPPPNTSEFIQYTFPLPPSSLIGIHLGRNIEGNIVIVGTIDAMDDPKQ